MVVKIKKAKKIEIHTDGVEGFFARAHKAMCALDKGERIKPAKSITFAAEPKGKAVR